MVRNDMPWVGGHHAPDTGQFRPFFFVLDLFFLCLHLKSMYIEMLEIHF